MIALICFFPVLVTTIDGLASLDPERVKLLRTLDASRWQSLRFAELPAALPAALSGARIALAVGVIGAFIAETSTPTTGTYTGLGREIVLDAGGFQTARAYAATVLLFAFAIACFYSLAVAERRLAPWRRPAAVVERDEARLDSVGRGDGQSGTGMARRGTCGARCQPAWRAACLLALGACGAKQDTLSAPGTKPFDVMLDWFPNADHAALYTALAHGEFRAVGLDVKLLAPSQTDEPLKLLAAGKVDMAVSYEPELLLARDQGLRVVSIGALVQRPLTSIIALPAAHVSSVADLKGKTVGTAGIPYQAAMLTAALHAAHLSSGAAKEVNVGFNLVPAMLSGKVDATLGGYWNYEAVQLAARAPLADRDPGRQGGRSHLRRAGAGGARKRGPHPRTGPARVPAGAQPRRARGARQPGGRGGADRSRPTPRCSASCSSNRSGARCRPRSPRRASPSAGRNRRAWAHFAEWMYSQRLTDHPPGAELPPFSNEFLPGQGI